MLRTEAKVNRIYSHQHGVKIGRNGMYKTKQYKAYEQDLKQQFIDNMRGSVTSNEPLRLSILVKYLKKARKDGPVKHRTKKPDSTNCLKGIEDILADVANFDDVNIAHTTIVRLEQDVTIVPKNQVFISIELEELRI